MDHVSQAGLARGCRVPGSQLGQQMAQAALRATGEQGENARWEVCQQLWPCIPCSPAIRKLLAVQIDGPQVPAESSGCKGI